MKGLECVCVSVRRRHVGAGRMSAEVRAQTTCSWGGLGFITQYPQQGAHYPLVISVPGDLTPSPGLRWHEHSHRHMPARGNTHMHTIKNKISL